VTTRVSSYTNSFDLLEAHSRFHRRAIDPKWFVSGTITYVAESGCTGKALTPANRNHGNAQMIEVHPCPAFCRPVWCVRGDETFPHLPLHAEDGYDAPLLWLRPLKPQ